MKQHDYKYVTMIEPDWHISISMYMSLYPVMICGFCQALGWFSEVREEMAPDVATWNFFFGGTGIGKP